MSVTDKPAWLDLSCGVAGEMLLGALLDAGVPLTVLREAIGALQVPVSLQQNSTRRHDLPATWVVVSVNEAQPARRPWLEVKAALERATTLAAPVRDTALAVFTALAESEAEVTGVPVESVVLHETGSYDTLAEVVGVCAGVHWLREQGLLTSVHATAIALGQGSTTGALGESAVPTPVVLGLLSRAQAPSVGGPADGELATRTGTALATTLVESWGPMPETVAGVVGTGAGSRDLSERANVVRLVLSS